MLFARHGRGHFFSAHLLFSAVFLLAGVYMMSSSERAEGFVDVMGRRLYGKKLADRVTAHNLLRAAWAFVIFGPLGAVMATYQIVHTLVTGSAV